MQPNSIIALITTGAILALFILILFRKINMTLQDILNKEDEVAAEVGKLVTAMQAVSAQASELQTQVAQLTAGQVTDEQLSEVASKLDGIKAQADSAIPQ